MPADIIEKLQACTGFEWDEGNLFNWEKHGVTVAECEQVFFNRPLLARLDDQHSSAEARFYLLGKADSRRRLFVVFTIREQRIRVISAEIKARENAGATSNMANKTKKIPKHKSEGKEREFWSKADSTDYIDWSETRPLVLPNLKPSLKTISLRLPEHMLAELKVLANKRDVPYQSLLKLFLAERLEEELQRSGSSELKT